MHVAGMWDIRMLLDVMYPYCMSSVVAYYVPGHIASFQQFCSKFVSLAFASSYMAQACACASACVGAQQQRACPARPGTCSKRTIPYGVSDPSLLLMKRLACPSAQLQHALAEAAAARRRVDGQVAENRALREQQRILDDARLKDEAAIRDLTNELADRQEQVAAAQRKLVMMRSSRCGAQPAVHLPACMSCMHACYSPQQRVSP